MPQEICLRAQTASAFMLCSMSAFTICHGLLCRALQESWFSDTEVRAAPKLGELRLCPYSAATGTLYLGP